jgi:methylated-DNA-[protein]-cysteine S-methyltransferase
MEVNILKLDGTVFQIKVWKEIIKISKGSVKTYKEIANIIGKPKSSRAVANACGKNPYVPLIPCHRVIRSDGYLGGYSGHGGIEEKKKKLLIKEGFRDFKIDKLK